MIRPITFVCMLMAGGAGLYLYQTKHRAQVLDHDIGETIKQTAAARERIGMLKAEWALLNEPDRLAELVKAHTGLRTLAPTQFVAINDLTARLPAPAAPTPPKAPTDLEPEEPPVPAVAQAAPPPTKSLAPARPAPMAVAAVTPAAAPALAEPKPAEPKPQTLAADKPARHPRPTAVQVAASTATPAPAPVHPATPTPARPAAVTPAPVSSVAVAPGTIGESVLRAMRANAAAFAPTTPAVQAPAPAAYVQPVVAAAPAYAAPSVGSLLGSARGSLPPPVPYVAR